MIPSPSVTRKDECWWMCIDCRTLNRQTVKARYPLPRNDMLLDRSRQVMVFMEIIPGVWLSWDSHGWRFNLQNSLHSSSGAMGVSGHAFWDINAPETFQRLMNRAFTEIDNIILAYLDGILVLNNSFKKHWSQLIQELQRLWEGGFPSATYWNLGLIISGLKSALKEFMPHKKGKGCGGMAAPKEPA